jgi:hypothetical protein
MKAIVIVLFGQNRLGPERLGTGTTWGRTGLGPDRPDTVTCHPIEVFETLDDTCVLTVDPAPSRFCPTINITL